MENEGFDRVKTPVARRQIADWTIKDWISITKDMVWNSWCHESFSYFPDEQTRKVVYKSDHSYSSSDEENDDGDEVLEPVGV